MPERHDDVPRGFVRVYLDLYPEVSDRLNTLAKERGMYKKALLTNIITEYLNSQETTRGKGKK